MQSPIPNTHSLNFYIEYFLNPLDLEVLQNSCIPKFDLIGLWHASSIDLYSMPPYVMIWQNQKGAISFSFRKWLSKIINSLTLKEV
jgi:hypothetical protein